jgi:hypothetical protein
MTCRILASHEELCPMEVINLLIIITTESNIGLMASSWRILDLLNVTQKQVEGFEVFTALCWRSSGLLRHVAFFLCTNVSEKHSASFFRIEVSIWSKLHKSILVLCQYRFVFKLILMFYFHIYRITFIDTQNGTKTLLYQCEMYQHQTTWILQRLWCKPWL